MDNKVFLNESTVVGIADAIREKTGSTEKMLPTEMISSIRSITGSGGINTSDATAVDEDILENKTAYVKGMKITGSMPNKSNSIITFDPITNSEIMDIPNGYYSNSSVELNENLKNELDSINGSIGTTLSKSIENINSSVSAEADLITQISAALEGKAAGGGGNTYADVTITSPYTPTVCYIGENGVINTTGTGTYKCLVPSIMYVYVYGALTQCYMSGDVTILTANEGKEGMARIFNITGAGTILYQSGGGGAT